jgi:hypothetical protein
VGPCMFIQPVPGRQRALTSQCKHPDGLSAQWGMETSQEPAVSDSLCLAWCWCQDALVYAGMASFY